jgi:protein-glucosylgalactosylhydroxylysine glucosidase
MTMPISPASVKEFRPEYLPAYLSNGVLGLRVEQFPQLGGLVIVNGFAGIDPTSGVEAFARAPYPVAGNVTVDDRSIADSPQCATLHEQAYDFSCGELRTRFRVDGGRVQAGVEVVTFCSRTQPTLVLQEVRVEVDHACDLKLTAGVDHVGVLGTHQDRRTKARIGEAVTVDGSMLWKSYGGLSRCGIAYVTEFLGAEAQPEKDESDLAPLSTTYAFRARVGRTYRLRQITSLVCEALHCQPDLQAVRLAYTSSLEGFETLRRRNQEAWEELWKGRVTLLGADARWQELADAAFFYLQTSVHPSMPTSTSPFGLAYWPGYHHYRGHVMWDIDTFAVPPLILTQPEAARTHLEFRSERLLAARHNASLNGYRGAQFPWESSLRLGDEAAPGEGPAAAHEHHVSADVAIAFSQYLHATNDWEWGRDRAWRVLEGVADWIASRGAETGRGFEILGAGGIAEKPDPVNNNAFMNMGASIALREAARLADPLGKKADPNWERLAEAMFLPIDRNGVIRNHDAYRRTEDKGETPEAAAALFPLNFGCVERVEQATLDFYLGLADDYVGAPMLSALLGVFAARLGDRERALELLERGYSAFVIDPFTITTEYDPQAFPDQPVAGPFTANIGGFLLSCLYGFPGLRIGPGTPQTWCARPVTMPAGWDGVEVQRVFARGRAARLVARHGDEHAQLELE